MKSRIAVVVLALGSLALGLLCVYVLRGDGSAEEILIEGPPPGLSGVGGPRKPRAFEPVRLMAPFPAVTRVTAEPPAQAAAQIGEEETVIGVRIGKDARAYPVAMMAEPQQEVLNDTLDGRPIAVTWCSRCRYAMIFDRRLDDQTLTFSVPGLIWDGTMVMADQETRTLWSQLLGQAEAGKLQGRELSVFPSVVTDWKTWKTKYPETTVAVLPRLAKPRPHRQEYDPEAKVPFVLGLTTREHTRTWTLDRLRSHSPINDQFQGRPLVAVYDEASATAGLFDRKLDGETLEFRMENGRLIDTKTSSPWDPTTGRALGGSMEGKELERMPAILIHADTWKIFHPEAETWKPDNAASRTGE